MKERIIRLNKILKYKRELEKTDYITDKLTEAIAESLITANNARLLSLYDEYKPVLDQRQAWRDAINTMEEELRLMEPNASYIEEEIVEENVEEIT